MSTDVQRGSKLYKMREEGNFKETSNRENLEEQIELLKNLNVPGNVLYSSGHIVNLVKVTSHMRNKEKMIKKLEDALENLDEKILDSKNKGRAIWKIGCCKIFLQQPIFYLLLSTASLYFLIVFLWKNKVMNAKGSVIKYLSNSENISIAKNNSKEDPMSLL